MAELNSRLKSLVIPVAHLCRPSSATKQSSSITATKTDKDDQNRCVRRGTSYDVLWLRVPHKDGESNGNGDYKAAGGDQGRGFGWMQIHDEHGRNEGKAASERHQEARPHVLPAPALLNPRYA